MGYASHIEELINKHRILLEIPKGKSPLQRPNRKCGTIIKWILNKSYVSVCWAFASIVMQLWVS